MANIKCIDVKIKTGDRDYAGTNGRVYIGVGGREFRVDSAGNYNDFERGDDKTYTFGEGGNVKKENRNDPQNPWQLVTGDLNKYPVYLRFEPRGNNPNWNNGAR